MKFIFHVCVIVQDFIGSLPEKDKKLLTLVDMGFSPEEAAAAIDRCGITSLVLISPQKFDVYTILAAVSTYGWSLNVKLHLLYFYQSSQTLFWTLDRAQLYFIFWCTVLFSVVHFYRELHLWLYCLQIIFTCIITLIIVICVVVWLIGLQLLCYLYVLRLGYYTLEYLQYTCSFMQIWIIMNMMNPELLLLM